MNKVKRISKIISLLVVISFLLIGFGFNDYKVIAKTTENVSEKVTENKDSNVVNTGYIYTGDSRIRRLNLTIKMSEKKQNWVFCKSGMGYNWFNSNSIAGINKTIKEHTEINNWVIISGWGVNDLWNINTYLAKYKELLYNEWSNCKLYLMSVNPVGSRLATRYSRISSFNSSLKMFIKDNKNKSGGRIDYIDTNSVMKSKGFSTIDNLHYSESTNRLIYNTIREKLDKSYATINYSKLELNIHAKRTLSISDVERKVRWTSSDKNVVKITSLKGNYSQKALIEAQSAGNAVITADCGVKKLRCKVNVTDSKVLVAYFSYSGEVENAAEYIHDYVGGDLYEIDTVKAYSNDEKTFAQEIAYEAANNLRPALLSKKISNINEYSKVYIGYPIWNTGIPKSIYTFADCYDWKNKIVIPFSIYEENGVKHNVQELQSLMPGAVLQKGCEVRKDLAYNKEGRTVIDKWLLLK